MPWLTAAWPVVDRLRRVIGDRRLVAVVGMVLAGVAACGALVAPWYSVVLPLGRTDPTTGEQADRVTAFISPTSAPSAPAICSVCWRWPSRASSWSPARRPPARSCGWWDSTVAAGLTRDGGGAHRHRRQLRSSAPSSVLVEGDFEVDNRSGLTAAFLAVILVGLALLAAGRAPAVDRTAPSEARPEWGWQPPRPVRDETAAEIAAAEPLDLTVQPSRPFARPDSDDDRTR